MSNNQLVNRLVSIDFIKFSFKDATGPVRELMETIVRWLNQPVVCKEVSAAMFVYQMGKILETIKKFQKKGYWGLVGQGSLQREVGIPDSLFKPMKSGFLRNCVHELIRRACEYRGEECPKGNYWFIDALNEASEDYFYRRGVFDDLDDVPSADELSRKMLAEQEEQKRIQARACGQVHVRVVYKDGTILRFESPDSLQELLSNNIAPRIIPGEPRIKTRLVFNLP